MQFSGHRLYAESVTIFGPNTGKIPAPVADHQPREQHRRGAAGHFLTHRTNDAMIYDVNSTLFRSFLRVSAAHGTGKEGKARAGPGEKKSDNKPVMNDM